uniref:Uncharacterized protein n=1 Tax=Panagrolaimus sp. ES5 TaxID=591445 RepID=A0AC34F0C2_9BILA
MLKFDITDKNYIHQTFPFPSPFIRYLMIKINSDGLKKLYKTCKYFYAKLQINIVDSLCIDREDMLYKWAPGQYDIKLITNRLDKLPNKVWITGDLLLGENLNISKFFSKVVRFDPLIVYLVLKTKFTMNELKILTQSQTITNITISMVIYLSHTDDTVVPVEDILPCFLSADVIE